MAKTEKIKSITYGDAFKGLEMIVRFQKVHNGKTKISYALDENLDSLKKVAQSYHKKKRNIEVKLANTDQFNSILYDENPKTGERTYKFTPENSQLRDTQVDELFEKGSEEWTPYVCTDVPEDLEEEYREFFETIGIIPNKKAEEKAEA